jgi:murein DD-endopeptidase MepM/ murein hydrolase activator NlpD
LARRSLKPQLNQIRTWARQGRTDAWIAHQLEASVRDIRAFKREHDLAPAEPAPEGDGDAPGPPASEEEPDLRAEDEALVAAALEAELEASAAQEDAEEAKAEQSRTDADRGDAEQGDEGERPRRRRGRRGGRGRGRVAKALEGTFDHGEEGYGLWLDPAVQDDPVYAEHWAGQRAITVTIEQDRIVIERAGGDSD